MTTTASIATSTALRRNLPHLTLDAKTATNTNLNTEIIGTVPEWLEGSLYRNGPGVFRVGQTNLRHLFDGFAVVHKFLISGGKVVYSSRVLDTETWVKSVKADRLIVTHFGTFASPDPCKSVFSRVMSFFKPMNTEMTDNASVNIVELGDRLYAMTETPFLVRVDPKDLRNVGKEILGKTFAVHLSTAHPLFDERGNMYNLATAFNPTKNYNIIKIPPPQGKGVSAVDKVELVASLQSRWKFSLSYNHSFGMTSRHFVILEQPLTMDAFKIATNNWRQTSHYQNYTKHPKEELIFRLINRDSRKEEAIKYRTEPTFTFHIINCYEDEEWNVLVIDLCGYSDMSVVDQLYLDALDKTMVPVNYPMPTYRRYVLPLSLEKAEVGQNLVTLPDSAATATLRDDGTVFLEADYITPDTVPMELPKINNKMTAKKHRYVYGVLPFHPTALLWKLDLKTRTTLTWEAEEGLMAGEPVFAPRPDASPLPEGEDEGVVLSPILAITADKTCFLLVLDAKTFKEIARAKIPDHVNMAMSFHGSFVQKRA